MKNFCSRELKALSLMVLSVFVVSVIFVPAPPAASAASIASGSRYLPASDGFNNPVLTASNIPQHVISIIKKTKGTRTELVLDPANTNRIYYFSQIADSERKTFRYTYDDQLSIVTLLVSITPDDQKPNYSYYYRYALGPNDSLALILSEGWIRNNILIPLHIYDYFAGGLQIRTFDKMGHLLKIESSEGLKKVFIYSQTGQLLTIQETDPLGQILFYHQGAAGANQFEMPIHSSLYNQFLYTVPTRDKLKRIENHFLKSSEILLAPSHLGENIEVQRFSSRFLLWLEAAHPLRAGPFEGIQL